MDPWAPINGISLERYAELSADVSDTQDPAKQAELVAQKGVSRADWDAAKAGWTARMQDMSLMGQVATRYMPLYQAALAKKSGGAPTVGFEDYVAMSGAAAVIGFEGMLAHYRVTQAQWTMIAGHWNAQIPTNPHYMQYGILVENEAARIRAGGQPRPVTLGAPQAQPQHAMYGGMQPGMQQPGMQQPGMRQPGMQQPGMAPNPYGAQPYPQQAPYQQGVANPFGTPQQQAQFNAQASDVGNQMANALSSFGSAFGSFVEGATAGFAVGSRVLVQWSDGNRYPGTVTAAQGGQIQVAFPDGRQIWVPQAYVSLSGGF